MDLYFLFMSWKMLILGVSMERESGFLILDGPAY